MYIRVSRIKVNSQDHSISEKRNFRFQNNQKKIKILFEINSAQKFSNYWLIIGIYFFIFRGLLVRERIFSSDQKILHFFFVKTITANFNCWHELRTHFNIFLTLMSLIGTEYIFCFFNPGHPNVHIYIVSIIFVVQYF